MAQLLLKVGATDRHDDGDILGAFNAHKISHVHAQHICHPWKAPSNTYHLRVPGSLAEKYYANTHEYMFARISHTEVVRINLWTGEQDTVGGTPNKKGEYIDVPLYIKRRCAEIAPDGGPKAPIFGDDFESVYWFGGNMRCEPEHLTVIWDEIFSWTGQRSTHPAFAHWPFGKEQPPQELVLEIPAEHRQDLIAAGHKQPFTVRYFGADRQYRVGYEGETVFAILGGQELRSHLAISVEDMSSEIAESLIEPWTEADPQKPDEPTILAKAKSNFVWPEIVNLLGVAEADIRDPTVQVDVFEEHDAIAHELYTTDKSLESKEGSINVGMDLDAK